MKSRCTTRAKNGAIDTLRAEGQSVRKAVYVHPTLQLSAKRERMDLLFPMAESKSLARKPLTSIVRRALPPSLLFSFAYRILRGSARLRRQDNISRGRESGKLGLGIQRSSVNPASHLKEACL